jgi:hypothetical protein
MAERQFIDCDGDTWTEFEPGTVRLTARANGNFLFLGTEDSTEDVRDMHGPLTEVPSDVGLDPDRLDRALRLYVADLDYDIHKGIECGEDDGVDHYPEHVATFLQCWEEAAAVAREGLASVQSE